jgi:ectoine hydroxylase-related dioxygenase (phytanoyl-CoA dioxygenase family)
MPSKTSAVALAARARDFWRDGYALLPAFLDPSEIVEAVGEVARLRAKPAEPSCVRPHNTLLPLRWSDSVVDLVLSASRRIEALSHALGGNDLRWISGYVSSKEPDSGPLVWHQDWWCWDHPISFEWRASQVALLCYLTPTDRDSGALRLLPRSHLKSTPLHELLPEAHDHDEAGEPDGPEFGDVPEQESLCLSPGDAVVLDYRLLHGTHGNTRSTRRDALLLSFTPSWTDLPDDLRAHLISHPALPLETETPDVSWATLLPHYHGVRRDLRLNRVPPASYEIV